MRKTMTVKELIQILNKIAINENDTISFTLNEKQIDINAIASYNHNIIVDMKEK